MKAKVLKDLVNKLNDNDDVLFEYSSFLFGEYREPKLYSWKKEVRYAIEEIFEDDPDELNNIVDNYNHVINFDN